MAENAAKSGATGMVGGGGGGGDDPPRKSNMNGNRSGRFGLDPVGKGRSTESKKSPTDSADEESKLLHQGSCKTTQVVKAGEGTDADSSAGAVEDGENGDLVKASDGHGVSVIDMADAGTQPYKAIKGKKSNVFKASYNRLLTTFEISKKSERPFAILLLVTLLLLLVIILLAIFWPRLPSYLTKEVCLEAECLEASKQILQWAKPDVNTCRTPYEWACGRFEEKYISHSLFGANKGEWNFGAYQKYEETTSAYEFISKLPSVTLPSSAQWMIKQLHSICTMVETYSNNEAATSLKRALNDLGRWRMLLEHKNHNWDVRENLQKVQPKYGATPFFKLGIDTRNAPPYDYIITVSEGDLGLPSYDLYTLEEKHPIIKAYQTYLKDILVQLVSVSTIVSQDYARMVYNYERRIALDVMSALRESVGNATQPQIRTLQQLTNEAPSLPILKTAQIMFEKKITENTQVLVFNPVALKMMSKIITTSDNKILNYFVMWSLIRHFVPYMSRNFRLSMQEFEKVLYGVQSKQPIWHFCTEVVQQWMPYGLEALRENPDLIVHDRSGLEYSQHAPEMDSLEPYQSSQLVNDDRIRYDEELVKMIFYHIRDEYKTAVINSNWINEKLTKFITDKLSMMRLQIGIPRDLVKNEKHIEDFYKDWALDNLLIVDNVARHCAFARRRMTRMLDNMTESERIVAELYPPIAFGARKAPVSNLKYSIALNMVIISRQKIQEPYFHHKYPLSLNFARLGADISLVLHDALNTLAEQFQNNEIGQPKHVLENVFDDEAQKCMTRALSPLINPLRISNSSKLNLYLEVAAGSMLSQAYSTLLDKIDRNERIFESEISEQTTYEVLGLRNGARRQPGLRRYDEQQLFTLAYLQKHCAVPDSGAVRLTKLLVDSDIPETEKLALLWHHVPALPAALECSSSSSSSFINSGGGDVQNGHCSRIL